MSRINCTSQKKYGNFKKLIAALKKSGFEVDHFHAVDLLEIPAKNVDPTHMNQRIHMRKDGSIAHFEEWVIHLNLIWKNGKVECAAWSEGGEGDPLNVDPRIFFSVVADEWHDR